MHAVQKLSWACFTAMALSVAGAAALTQDTAVVSFLEPVDTSSPRATLASFIAACEEAYRIAVVEGRLHTADKGRSIAIERASRCLDLTEVPEFLRGETAKEASLYLKEILDRIDLPPPDAIPGEKEVAGDTGLTSWAIPRTEITLVRMEQGERKGAYLFSAQTVANAQDFYKRIKHLPYHDTETPGFLEWRMAEPGSAWLSALVRRLPAWARTRVNGHAVWQWVGLFLTTVIALYAMFLAYRIGRRLAAAGPTGGPVGYAMTLLFPIAAMLIPLAARGFVIHDLHIGGGALVIAKFTANLVFLLALLVVILGAGVRVAELIVSSPRFRGQGIDAALVRLVVRVLSLVAATIVFLEGGKHLGIPMSTLLAGAGVGGLAVALGAQDAIKNIIGSMMIILDKPYQAGERIVVKGYDGVVEDIGLRSTKLRLLTGHQVSVPNEVMAQSDIENIGRRPHIRRVIELALSLDMTPAKAEEAVRIVADLLKDHEGQDPAFPPRVWFGDIARDALMLKAIYWYHPPKYWDFTAHAQQVNARILEELARADIRLARPATTSYLAQDADGPLKVEWSKPRADGQAQSKRTRLSCVGHRDPCQLLTCVALAKGVDGR